MSKTTRTERADETREAMDLTDENWLSIPEKVRARFLDQGYTLKWVRVAIKGQDDFKNVGTKLRDGYSFVEPDEAPEMAAGFQIGENKLGKLVLRGDVALAKAPTDRVEARKATYAKRTRDLTNAVDQQLMQQSDRRMPISNNSRSKTSLGNQARFDD